MVDLEGTPVDASWTVTHAMEAVDGAPVRRGRCLTSVFCKPPWRDVRESRPHHDVKYGSSALNSSPLLN
ncbi:hypothetical protein [Streptomyces sp. NPDC001492]